MKNTPHNYITVHYSELYIKKIHCTVKKRRKVKAKPLPFRYKYMETDYKDIHLYYRTSAFNLDSYQLSCNVIHVK